MYNVQYTHMRYRLGQDKTRQAGVREVTEGPVLVRPVMHINMFVHIMILNELKNEKKVFFVNENSPILAVRPGIISASNITKEFKFTGP